MCLCEIYKKYADIWYMYKKFKYICCQYVKNIQKYIPVWYQNMDEILKYSTLIVPQQEEEIRREWYQMRAEERLKAEGRLVDGEAAPADILAQVI